MHSRASHKMTCRSDHKSQQQQQVRVFKSYWGSPSHLIRRNSTDGRHSGDVARNNTGYLRSVSRQVHMVLYAPKKADIMHTKIQVLYCTPGYQYYSRHKDTRIMNIQIPVRCTQGQPNYMHSIAPAQCKMHDVRS